MSEGARDEASFVHDKSHRRFRVYRQNGRLRHQEFLIGDGTNEDLLLCDFPVSHTIGSGNNSRSYLVEKDGFLYESPITWYTSKKGYSISPGYDALNHPSFSRIVDGECLKCHAGQFESVSADNGRLKLHEQRIGCENCRGPGSQHVALRSSLNETAGGVV